MKKKTSKPAKPSRTKTAAKPPKAKVPAKPAAKPPTAQAKPAPKQAPPPTVVAPPPEKRSTISLGPPPASRLIETSPRLVAQPAAPAVTPPGAVKSTKSSGKSLESSDASVARLRKVKGFVLDLDGTLVLGDSRNHGIRALPNAIEFIAYLRSKKIPLVALTNGTIRTPWDIAQQLRAAQFDLAPHEVLTPSAIAANYFQRNDIHRVMVLGVEGSSQPLAESGCAIVPPKKGERADAIFVGWFRTVTMDHIEAACGAVERGARMFTASMAPYFASAEGRTLGTSCAIVGAIGAITGAQATVMGKPSLEGLNIAAERMKVDTRDIAVIGDDPDLEIPMAHAGGSLAIGVTTGTGKADDFANAKGEPAHMVVPGIGDVLRLIGK